MAIFQGGYCNNPVRDTSGQAQRVAVAEGLGAWDHFEYGDKRTVYLSGCGV